MKNPTIGLLIDKFTYFCSNNCGVSSVLKTNQPNEKENP